MNHLADRCWLRPNSSLADERQLWPFHSQSYLQQECKCNRYLNQLELVIAWRSLKCRLGASQSQRSSTIQRPWSVITHRDQIITYSFSHFDEMLAAIAEDQTLCFHIRSEFFTNSAEGQTFWLNILLYSKCKQAQRESERQRDPPVSHSLMWSVSNHLKEKVHLTSLTSQTALTHVLRCGGGAAHLHPKVPWLVRLTLHYD